MIAKKRFTLLSGSPRYLRCRLIQQHAHKVEALEIGRKVDFQEWPRAPLAVDDSSNGSNDKVGWREALRATGGHNGYTLTQRAQTFRCLDEADDRRSPDTTTFEATGFAGHQSPGIGNGDL